MSADTQQGDVLILQTLGVSGGLEFTIEAVNGILTMSPDFQTAAFVSLFGGNFEDDGTAGNPESWWGNGLENETRFMVRSRTQALLQSIPATSGNLQRIQAAAEQDLRWFTDQFTGAGVANFLDVEVSIPALNRVAIVIRIEAFGVEDQFTFTENWKAAA